MDNENKATLLISWLAVLQDGYVKPDANATLNTSDGKVNTNTTGVIRDTKDNKKYIEEINRELSQIFELRTSKIERKEL